MHGEAQKAIEFAMSNLQKSGIEMPEEITLGIFLGDTVRLAQSEGYTGVGSMEENNWALRLEVAELHIERDMLKKAAV